MTNPNRIIINTIILYVKVAVCAIISLWSVRIVFQALGTNDFGLYNLIAGVIAMLSFLNASMTVSTQRYLSVAIGENNERKINLIYNTSILLHIIIGIIIVFLFELAVPLLFNGFLNIDHDKIRIAKFIYQLLVINMFVTVITVPFNAILNAYENMIVYSLIIIFDSLLKLGIAFLLTMVAANQLQIYSIGICGITIVSFCITLIYTIIHYKQLKISLYAFWDKAIFKEMLAFCWWNTFGGFAMACKNQGIAIIQNLFLGTIINAAMGIANQINGMLCLFSSNIQKSINPQLMMSEGENDLEKRSNLSYSLSKFSTLALALVAVPLIVEMPFILQWWLNDVPEHTVAFSRLILVASLIYQLSSGLMSAIQSKGEIKLYQILVSIIIVLNIPFSYICLKLGCQPEWTLLIMIGIEILCLFYRLITAHIKVNIDIRDFTIKVLLPVTIIICVAYAITFLATQLLPSSWWRLLCICILCIILISYLSWKFVLSIPERKACILFINQKLHIHV